MQNLTNLRPFQLILIGVFGAFAIAGLIMFSMFRGSGDDQGAISLGVEVWGTIDASVMRGILIEYTKQDDSWMGVRYVYKDPRTFHTEFTNALAESRGPDVVIITNDMLAQDKAKLVPHSAISERDFRDAYVEAAEIFRLPDGLYAFPLVIDPLVMYWNRDLFSAKGLAAPPRTWEEFVGTTVPRLTTRTGGIIVESAAGIGEYSNVQNAKPLFLTLLMQAGGAPVILTQSGSFSGDFNRAAGSVPLPPGEAALRFYTSFANPATTLYTWSRSFSLDRTRFLSGNVAVYFGFASELRSLETGNPNLNFDVAEMPQSAGATTLRTYGTVYGVAIARGTSNPQGAFEAARGLSSQYVASVLTRDLGYAPTHRALVAAGSNDAFTTILLRAALISRGWYDPNPVTSNSIFSEMIESVTSGRAAVGRSIIDASERLRYSF